MAVFKAAFFYIILLKRSRSYYNSIILHIPVNIFDINTITYQQFELSHSLRLFPGILIELK